MFSKELESVIEAALADGVLTEKEREVLHKRAAAEGVDPDELDVVIDGRLAKMKREEDWLRPAPPKVSDKFGDVKKCPNCGEVVEAGTAKCSACGYVFRNIQASSSATRLAEKIEAVNEAYRDKIANAGTFKEPQINLSKLNEIAGVIRNFPVPASKDDLLEFMTSMKAKWANTGAYDGPIKKAYKAKYDESVNKAKVLFPDDQQFQTLFENFEQTKKKGCMLMPIVIVFIISLITII